jgi:hypothetical protein
MAEWSVPFAELAAKVKEDMASVSRQGAIALFTDIIMQTPVDQGRLRANWNCSLSAPDEGTSLAWDDSGSYTISKMTSSVLAMSVKDTVYLTNALPYAATVEYGLYPNPPKRPTGKTAGGYSIQAPAGMVRVSVMNFAENIKEAVRA